METQRCLYEILGVEFSASNEEIRSAYRKLALKFHPDKIQQSGASPEACQEATLHFQEIGRAYEVLADPSERSWYDSHRSQILSSSSSSSVPSDFDFNPWPYFSPSVFAGYGDTDKGFYAVYGELFTKLHQQEVSFARAYGLRVPEYPPDMGNLSTIYSQVQKLYNHWLGFSTVKDFSWCDEYRASMGPNRKLRRLMEEENKKIRSKARKEFNEVIRRLAAFVKKRDKRVLERQMEVQRLEKEKEEMRKVRRIKEEEEKLMKARQYEEAEWTKIELEHDPDDGSDFDESIGSYTWGQSNSKSSGGKKERQDEFFCIVCNKKFKSDEQWRNHERSRKHLEIVAILKLSLEEDDKQFEEILHGQMQDENANIMTEAFVERILQPEESPDTSDTGLSSEIPGKRKAATNSSNDAAAEYLAEEPRPESNVLSSENDSDDAGRELQDGEDDDSESLLIMVNSYASRQRQSASEDSDDAAEPSALGQVLSNEGDEDKDEGEEEMLAAMLKSHQIQQAYHSDEDCEDPPVSNATSAVEVENVNEDIGALSKKKKSKARLRNEKQQAASLNRHVKIEEELMCDKEVGIQRSDAMAVDERDSCAATMQDLQEEIVMLEKDPIDIRKAEKVEKRHRRESLSTKGKSMNGHSTVEVEQRRRPPRGKKGKGSCKNIVLTCETCGEDFDSRNQLFNHISATRHAVLRGK